MYLFVSSLLSCLPVLLSCSVCGRIPRPGITVSVVEVGRPEQAQRAVLLQMPGAGPPLGVPFVLAQHSQPLRAPLWSACGCGGRRSHSRQPMDRSSRSSIVRRSLSSFQAFNQQRPGTNISGQVTEVTECDRQANNHSSAAYLLPSTR